MGTIIPTCTSDHFGTVATGALPSFMAHERSSKRGHPSFPDPAASPAQIAASRVHSGVLRYHNFL